VGERTRVLIDSVTNGVATARSAAEAPEIDGVIRIEAAGDAVGAGEKTIGTLKAGEKTITRLKAGEWADVEIVAADAYDLTGRLTASNR
jgi:ribosomal protein S12 methylthiotransferase